MLKLKSIVGLALFLPLSLLGQIYMEMAMDTSMTYQEIVEEAEIFFDQHGRGSHTGYKAYKRWAYWMKRCLDDEGHMMTNSLGNDGFSSVVETMQSIEVQNWNELGPMSAGNTSGWSSHIGRITSIGIDKSNENHLLVATPSGGIWKSTDGGDDWTPIFDKQPNLKIYSLLISPHNSDHYYAGTWGNGIVRSTDGGSTWQSSNGIRSGRIIRILASETDPNILLAINEGGNIFKSFNGGLFWNNRYIHKGTMYDLEYKPGDPNIIYASGKGIVLVSHDAGTSFTEMTGPWQQTGVSNNPIMLAVTPADPDYIYVLEAANGGFGALYLSEDGGKTFESRSDNDAGGNNIMGYLKAVKGGQAPRDMDIGVSPINKNEVHVGGVMTFRSMDAGVTWLQTSHWLRNDPLPFIHPDVDIIEYTSERIYFGTDGGLFTSEDSGLSFADKTTGLGIRQFYRIDVEGDTEHLVVGGSQDNGVGTYRQQEGWVDFIGADGMESVIDRIDNDIIYGSIQYGNIYKSKNGGLSLSGGFKQSPGFGDWVTPLEQDPIAPHTLYQGKQQVYKTSDGAVTWEPISDFQTNNPVDTFLQEMAIAPSDNRVIVAAFEEQVFRTEDGGASWVDISPEFEFLNVNYVSIHPRDSDRVIMALSGTKLRVVESLDGGASWIDKVSNLPLIAAECVIYEGGPADGIYVSMDPGIFYLDKTMSEWTFCSSSMPNVLVTELEIRDCTIYAATYGRGLWSSTLIDKSSVYADADGDGYGDSAVSLEYCFAPDDYVFIGGDCDDSEAMINPSASEIIGNDIDENCDGVIPSLDEDGDGYDSYEDCDDSDPSINSGMPEVCFDGVDNDCDGQVDEDCGPLEDCDGYYLVLRSFYQDVYRASSKALLYAKLSVGDSLLVTAGEEIDILPGFEVELGARFEARIEPCFFGSSYDDPDSVDIDAASQGDINQKFGSVIDLSVEVYDPVGELVTSKELSSRSFVSEILEQLSPGDYWIHLTDGQETLSSLVRILE